MINLRLKENPLRTKREVQEALHEIIKPLEAYFDTSQHGLKFDSGGAHCIEMTREVEALLRPLWGIVPFLAGGGDPEVFQPYLEKIKQGTDSQGAAYWGEISNRDQLMVEMASIGTGLCFAKKYFWDALTLNEQENLYRWLEQVNHFEMPPTNWLFFRVLVNLGFKNCGQPFSEKQVQADLADLDSYFIGNGWYVDGYPDQIDYYIPFAFHFYGLLYIKAVGDAEDAYTKKFKERAIRFAHDFVHFFTNDGVAIPYGRSLTYRFAQSSFWGALAFADVAPLPWGEIKHLALQNLRHWFKQEIFSSSGELTIGYYYRNLVMAEGYNAFGSPYWALKSFIFLSLEDTHPFWASEETVPKTGSHLAIPQMRAIIERDKTGNQVQLFTMGQHCEGHAHVEAKYEKFVYSTAFGFSVSKSILNLSHGAFDNTLAVSDDGRYYRSRYGVEAYGIKNDYLYSIWKPYPDTVITTYLVPLCPWHVRIHEIQTSRKIVLAEGGFGFDLRLDAVIKKGSASICKVSGEMISGITSLAGDQRAKIIIAEPNTNIYFDRSAIPTLQSETNALPTICASAVLGAVGKGCEKYWEMPPVLEISDEGYRVRYCEREIMIKKEG